jgi:hypothetical protein
MDNEPVTWRKFAAETRRIAADICDEAVREKYLQLAAGYDNLAQTAAARIEADTESYRLATLSFCQPT